MSVRPNIALPDDLHRRMKMQAIDQGVTVQAYIVNSIWKIVLHDEASVHQRKTAKEPK